MQYIRVSIRHAKYEVIKSCSHSDIESKSNERYVYRAPNCINPKQARGDSARSGFYFITSKIVQLAKKAENADISVLSNFLAIFFKFFLYIEKFYQVLSTCQISDQLDHSNRNYRLGAESALPQPYQSAKSPACLGLTYVSVQNTIRCLCWTGKLSSLHDVEFSKSTGYVLGIHEAKKNFSLYMIDF